MSAFSAAFSALGGLLCIAFATGVPALTVREVRGHAHAGRASTTPRYERPIATTTYERSVIEHADIEEIAPSAPPKPCATFGSACVVIHQAKVAIVAAETRPKAEGQSVAGDIVVREMLDGRIRAQLDTLPVCWRGEGPSGPGAAEVTYAPEGVAVVKLAPPYADTPVGACVKRRLQLAAQPFDGAPITVRIPFQI